MKNNVEFWVNKAKKININKKYLNYFPGQILVEILFFFLVDKLWTELSRRKFF